MPALTEEGRQTRSKVLSILGNLVPHIQQDAIDEFDWDACARRTLDDIIIDNKMTTDEYNAAWDLHREQLRLSGLSAEYEEIDRRQADLDERTAVARIPERYRDAPLDLTYLDDFANGRGLYVYGVMGSGKTFRASSVLRGWLSRNKGKGLFVTSTQMLTEIDATYSNTESVLEVADRYGRCPMLVIDDLGKETPTEHVLSMLWHVINTRYSWKLPTVFTSQYKLGELANRLGERGNEETAGAIVSRIRETCVGVDMGVYDLRRG